MANVISVPLYYCLEHAAYFVVREDEGGVYHNTAEGRKCYGTYTDSPPPPELTEKEWAHLLSVGELVETGYEDRGDFNG